MKNMVLEKSSRVPIWGKADPGEEVKVSLAEREASTKADDSGKWATTLDLKDCPPEPLVMSVKGYNEITLSDVVVGEVWVASGQSNMEWALKNTLGAEEEIADSSNPMIRQFKVKRNAARKPADDVTGEWVAASPGTSGNFSAARYYFGKAIESELKVPVGIINTSWGGTPAEAWTSPEAIATHAGLEAGARDFRQMSWSARDVLKRF